jgi:multidrug resistance protein, MATE family
METIDPISGADHARFRDELRVLARLALPIVLTQISMMSLGIVDLAMVGRVSSGAVEALDAVALGNVWKIGTAMVAMGLVLGIDPLIAQAHGRRDAAGLAHALQRGVVIALGGSVPVALLWMFTKDVLVAMGQDPAIAAVAHDYVLVQLPSVPFFLVFAALRQYLQGRGILAPTLWIAVAANVVNAGLNWVFIYGHLGSPALGAVGSGIATSIGQVLMPLGMLYLIRAGKLHEGAWRPWSRAALDPRELRVVLAVGIPVAAHFAAEIWGFQIVALWSGRLGTDELAANAIVLNLASLTFMVPLGIGLASVTRVGNLIGERRPHAAQTASWAALALGSGAMTLAALAFIAFRTELPRAYTAAGEVIAICAATLPVAAAFQLFDGVQVVSSGILRAMGATRPIAVANLVGYYVIGLPIGGWLAFRLGQGVPGLWWGLAAGLAVVASSLLAWVAVRGPARAIAAGPGDAESAGERS